MSYTALYRKWRPQTFEDVKGQDHIVTTLQNQIRSQRIGHAYLFCGTRGTGRTSVAKIFARAVNCEHPVNGSPCGICSGCQQIAAGTSLNVVEIDAASNNGVENIREIRDQVQYPPTEGRYRVYIIDEVHMLSTGAFNALLKTLEEPPSYVIFILATTEVHKIPITVLSRCQRYDFRRITVETIADRLKELTDAEQMPVEEKALRYVAKAGDGSMRDALSLLDQCAAFHFGETLTYEHVLDVLGAVDNSVFRELFHAVREGRTKDCILKLEEMVIQGRELSQFVTDFIWFLRNVLLLKTAADAEELLDGTPMQARDAEWYFLKGNVYFQRGWLDDALNHFSTACRLSPNNPEYRAAMNRMMWQRQGNFGSPAGGYRTGTPVPMGGCSTCDICNSLLCADCCCECMGGDLISCC